MNSYRCITWNILAQSYWKDDTIKWSDRLQSIITKIIKTNSDIICLQEIELLTVIDDFEPLFEMYNYDIHKINKKRSNQIGNMILWKKTTFYSEYIKYNST